MPRVRRLDVFVPDHDPARCAFAGAAAPVVGAYERALGELGLVGPASSVMLVAQRPDPGQNGVLVLVDCDRPDSSESVRVRVPDDVADAAPPEVARLVADVLDGALARLAVARRWDGATLSAALTSARARSVEGTAPAPRWTVRTEGRGVTAPEQPHELTVVGGGPANGAPRAYDRELQRLLDRFSDDGMQAWWSGSPVRIGDVWYWFDAPRPGVRITVTRRVTAAIHRPVRTIREADPVALARADVRALLERLATRLDLPPAPLLDAEGLR
ncbi:hypothetical protein ACH436_18740 [Isoptericola sp. NPDC019693]|uniref:hypothetical protein n=1 Tax=Isoptericola sp. NPDC019693 TaxID=3364009 RepID=UPI0037BBEC13